MPAYLIAQGRIDDPERFQQYLDGVVPTLEARGGQPLVIADEAELLEGESDLMRLVALQFESVEAARAWHDSPEYQAVAEHRKASSVHRFLLAPGFEFPG
jgi:uncharacterized protein (DUF1330 family)